ncbi:MAG TPA: 6-phosphogluconolactonase [Armatimonadota bacterium]|jgi:glucosamine-6-phosphate deaminase
MRQSTLGTPAHAVPVEVYPDPVALGEALAGIILRGVAAASREGRRYLLGCPGGRSAVSTYEALGAQAADLSGLVIVMMDEYLVPGPGGLVNCPAEAHNSCHRFAAEIIRGNLNRRLDPARQLPADQVWFPDPADPAAYEERLREAGGIDLFILASGASDGHVAFNPPGTPADALTGVVRLAESTRRDNMVTFPDFTDLSEVPGYGVTVGLGTIAGQSRQAVLIAHGPDKRYAVSQLACRGEFAPDWPATIIFNCQQATIMLDEAAVSG